MVSAISHGDSSIFTDAEASPTGFPFKVMKLKDTIGDLSVLEMRKKICNLGYLRDMYKKADGSIGYRCSAENQESFIQKGGDPAEAASNKCCLCNSLLATIGLPGTTVDGEQEKPLVTLGSHMESLKQLVQEKMDFSARDVISYIMK